MRRGSCRVKHPDDQALRVRIKNRDTKAALGVLQLARLIPNPTLKPRSRDREQRDEGVDIPKTLEPVSGFSRRTLLANPSFTGNPNVNAPTLCRAVDRHGPIEEVVVDPYPH